MERRSFFKLVSTASGAAVTGACGKQATEIIPLLVPEESIVPGVEQWQPSTCGECAAGCGTLARVMAAEREIEHEGERVRQRIAAIKKLEGNPSDPVGGGGLCARGHAALQATYSPDRLQGPMRREGARGSGTFVPIPWDDALQEAATAIKDSMSRSPAGMLFLARPCTGTRTTAIARFLDALGAPPAQGTGSGDLAAEYEAAARAFGWNGLPVYELQDATLALSIGADFLGGWASPVLYSRRYGHMRQGRRELRGRLVHAESRFSITAWNADRWLPVLPGGELALARGIGAVLVREGLVRDPGGVPQEVLAVFSEVDLDRAAAHSGIAAADLESLATDLAEALAPLVIGGASIVREDSADAVTAACALNLLLGNVGQPGGVLPPAATGTGLEADRPTSRGWSDRLAAADMVLLDQVNPVYTAPGTADQLARVGTVISFSPVVDETSVYADLILPDHTALERGGVAVPQVSPVPSLTAAPPFVAPLYDTREIESVLGSLAGLAGRAFSVPDVREVLGGLPPSVQDGESTSADPVSSAMDRGTWMGKRLPAAAASPRIEALGPDRARPAGLLFQAYPSLQFAEGTGADRPWLQELPDPTSSAMWGLPVELAPASAAEIGVDTGDVVRVESAHGSLLAPVYVHPAAIPGVVSMALGQGRYRSGRFASGKGANPMDVVGDLRDAATGASVLGPVPVTVSPEAGGRRLVQFSRQDRPVVPHRG